LLEHSAALVDEAVAISHGSTDSPVNIRSVR
jgi:hypothetical protein